jgi:general secretion pathway protein L
MRLVVEVPRDGTEWRFVLLNDALQTMRYGQCTPDLLPTATELIAALPAECVTWHALALPKQTGGRLRAVLEGLLEDAVLGDLGGQYIALAGEQATAPDSKRWAIVCDAAWLQTQMDALQAAQRQAQWITATLTPAFDHAQIWWQDHSGQSWVTVQSPSGVWSGDPNAIAAESLEGAHSAEPAAIAWAEQQLQRKVPSTAWHEQLTRCAQTPARAWGNLAQFQYAHFGNQSWLQRLGAGISSLALAPQWRALRWGCVALLAVNIIGLQWAAYQQRQAISAKRAAADALLTQSYPEVRVVIDAPAQMQKMVEASRLRSGQLASTDFESVLSTWASSGGSSASNAPQNIEYRDGQLKVTPAGSGRTGP